MDRQNRQNRKNSKSVFLLIGTACISISLLYGSPGLAQQVADPGFVSVGRGAPLSPAIPGPARTNPLQLESYPPAEIAGYPEQYWMVGPFNDAIISADGEGSSEHVRRCIPASGPVYGTQGCAGLVCVTRQKRGNGRVSGKAQT